MGICYVRTLKEIWRTLTFTDWVVSPYEIPDHIFTKSVSPFSQILKADHFCVFSAAVRFGRIPKREKQRLLDEMQSYMNSLNESAAMEVESPARDSPTSTDDCNSKEAIGAISRAYRDIFASSSSIRERSANISTNNNNNTTTSYSQDGNFAQVSSNPTPTHNYCPVARASACPAASQDNKPVIQNVDNNHYSYLVSTHQNHGQSNYMAHQRSSSVDNSFGSTGNIQNQPSCPWKLPPGAKVLVITINFL